MEPPPTATALTTLGIGEGALTTLGLMEEAQEQIQSMTRSLRSGTLKSTRRMWLQHPTVNLSDILPLKAHVDLDIFAKLSPNSLLTKTPVSPELQGRGSSSCLFTSNKSAWVDPSQRSMGVANMVEVNVREIVFPTDDVPEETRLYKYHVEARCNGVRAATKALCRPKKTWKAIIPLDTSEIDFKGTTIFVPLPPGCWSSAETIKVRVQVMRTLVNEVQAVNFNELLSRNGRSAPYTPTSEVVYHADLFVDGMSLDFSRQAAGVPFARATAPPTYYGVAKDELSPVETPALVVMDIALRDRDYARLHTAQDSLRAGMLCVGDKAMLKVEEPIRYPNSEVEYRNFLNNSAPGQFDPARIPRGPSVVAWEAPLRDPCATFEYKASGLDKLDPPEPFKQRYMPNASGEVIPHKFVLPKDEAEFQSGLKPGSFWRIMEYLAGQKVNAVKTMPNGDEEYEPQIIRMLTHVVRSIPTTVLAVYPDQTCDVELAPNFVQMWEAAPYKAFGILGAAVIGDHTDISDAAIRNAPVGAGDVGERVRRRILLKGLPISSLSSVQSASFNVYDAAITTTDEIVHIHPHKVGNDYNPRLIDGAVDDMQMLSGHRGSYRVVAGPLPVDANPADCQYEWSLSLNARDEADMYHFITVLRQAARMDIAEQVKKLQEFKKKSAFALNNRPYLDSQIYSTQSGHLEVILVEARHLRPTRVQQEQDWQASVQKSLQLELQTEAGFSLLNSEDGKRKELIYKGSKVQMSPPLSGSNPSWGDHPELQASGGWVFKSPLLEARSMPNLYFEIDLTSRTLQQIGQTEKLGMVRMAVFGAHFRPEFLGGAPTLDLSDPKKPFNNLWIPLSKSDKGLLEPKPYGELHIMTLWRPSQETAITRRLPKKVQVWQSYELKQAMKNNSMHDPIYEVQALQTGYDPNLYAIKGEQPASQSQANLSHMQKMFESVPYLDCCERQQRAAWRDYRQKLMKLEAEQGRGAVSLSAWREKWAADAEGATELWKLDEMLRRGVPAGIRNHVWPEITRANTLQSEFLDAFAPLPQRSDGDDPASAPLRHKLLEEKFLLSDVEKSYLKEVKGSAADRNAVYQRAVYRRLLEIGRPYRNDAMGQLHEDLVAAASWEKPTHHATMARHFKRLKRAEDICVALIAFSQESYNISADAPNCSQFETTERVTGVAYCESMLALAFFLLIAQTPSSRADEDEPWDFWDVEPEQPPRQGESEEEIQRKQEEKERKQKEKAAFPKDEVDDEVQAFWIVFSLASNMGTQPFRDFYGVPKQRDVPRTAHTASLSQPGSPAAGAAPTNEPQSTGEKEMPIADRRGAMDDLLRLNYILSRMEPELWVHLTALGFHPSMVFHASFMRLFAFTLPVTSLFRLWDMLLGESCRRDLPANKPARHGLIDLAYAGLTTCKDAILKCQSAAEVQSCLQNFFESIYDPSYLVELVAAAEYKLWDKEASMAKIGVPSLHTMDYENSRKHWDRYQNHYRLQNYVLRELCQDTSTAQSTSITGGTIASKTSTSNVNGGNVAVSQTGVVLDMRLTTRSVMKIFNQFVQHLANSENPAHSAGILRQLPVELVKALPESDGTVQGQVWSWISKMVEHSGLVDKTVGPTKHPISHPVPIKAQPGGIVEPAMLDRAGWMIVVQKVLGISPDKAQSQGDPVSQNVWQKWSPVIWDRFNLDPMEKKMSILEFFMGLICCSKGTVSDKAIALFHLYAFHGQELKVPHINPISRATGIIIERNEGKSQEDAQFLRAPSDEEVKTMALHLKVWVYALGASRQDEKMIGEVFVPSLVPYVTTSLVGGTVGSDPKTFTIWGPEKQMPPGFSREQDPSLLTEHGVRPHVGDMLLDLKWMPVSASQPEVGQLGITLISVKLDNLDAPETKNPRVEVVTYTETNFTEVRLPRWDPRSTMRKISHQLAMAPAVTEHVQFDRTMRREPSTGRLFKKVNSGDHGWNNQEKVWKWAPQYGQQYSAERTTFRKAVCERAVVSSTGNTKPNLITMHACRLITAGILTRSLQPVTHRQCIQIAENVFSRCQAVPGILDAILIEGDCTGASESLVKAKEEFAEQGKNWTDVKKNMIVAHELHVAMTGFGLDMFTPDSNREVGKALQLSMLEIPDPYPEQPKTLWLRYCRAGDGQRFNARIPVDSDGLLRGGEVRFDMNAASPSEAEAAQVQLHLTKQEFVNCLMSSSLLSESLRQLSTTDNNSDYVPPATSIRLDVTIADPTKEAADADLMDTLNIRQAVVLEIWDSDMGKTDDFLGECWLPPLGSLTEATKRYVLPVQNAEMGMSRKHNKKFSKMNCEGYLTVEASWIFPSEKAPPLQEGATMEQRVKREEMLHTGKLKLKIVKAEGLRGADRSYRREGSDPYVCMYVKNEAIGASDKASIPPGFDEEGWHVTALRRHECYWTTNTKKATRNPEWNEEKDFTLRTGGFERRTKQAFHLDITSGQARRHQDDYYTAVLGTKEELRLRFGDDDKNSKEPKIGYASDVVMYMADNMQQFKEKLSYACKVLAKQLLEQERQEKQKDPNADKKQAYKTRRKHVNQLEAAARDMSYRHSCMVFVPTKRLRELAQRGREGWTSYEYKRLYAVEEQDPSSWQPLDNVCTFSHYASLYSFGRTNAQRLKVADSQDIARLNNNRYRLYEKQQKQYLESLADTNTAEKCFGFAKFHHPSDVSSEEWRPALIDRSETVATSKRKYKVSYVFSPYVAVSADSREQEEVDEECVLLAPSKPKIRDVVHVEHKELLARAKLMKDQGVPEEEIVRQLNADLKKSFEKAKEANEDGAAMTAPPMISLADVQDALKRAKEDEADATLDGGQ
ncbi:fadB [Symbiodinium sp. KB8]|nr:fadB [Symbiodinium sp. KB8]